MTARFDLKAAERDLADSEAMALQGCEVEDVYESAGILWEHLSCALPEIRRLLGMVHEFHEFAPRETSPFGISCACPDCAAWREASRP